MKISSLIRRKATDREVQIATATSRYGGVVGKSAIVPKLVTKIAKRSDRILDFGSGKDACQAVSLQRRGWDVTAYDFGDNLDPSLHNPKALKSKYNLVYASNVLNVQSTRPMLESTIAQIKSSLSPGGKALMNYPESPRKIESLDGSELAKLLSRYFSSLRLVAGTRSAPVYLAFV